MVPQSQRPSQSAPHFDEERIRELERFAGGLLPIWERQEQIEVAQAAVFHGDMVGNVNSTTGSIDEPMPWKKLPSQVPPKRMAAYVLIGLLFAASIVYWGFTSNFIEVLAPRNVSRTFERPYDRPAADEHPHSSVHAGENQPSQPSAAEMPPAPSQPVLPQASNARVEKPLPAAKAPPKPVLERVSGSVAPKGAKLTLDGEPTKTRRGVFTLELERGSRHTLSASAKGYLSKDVNIVVGSNNNVDVKLEPEPKPQPRVELTPAHPPKTVAKVEKEAPKKAEKPVKPASALKKPKSDIVTENPY